MVKIVIWALGWYLLTQNYNAMKISVLANTRAKHQLIHQFSFIKGCIKAGIRVLTVANEYVIRTDAVVCWGWRKGKRLQDLGYKVLVMERGYIGDRFKYTSLGWNGLNNFANYAEYPDDNGKRFLEHGGVLKPWKKAGKYILICGQVKHDMSLRGQDIMPWYKMAAQEASKHYNLPVYFRPHPLEKPDGYKKIEGVQNITGSLADNLSDALFTIAYNSNTCLDSILEGVPCFAGDKGTMAWDLCMKDLKQLYYPSREKLVNQIAFKQFTLKEIEEGWPLKELMQCM